MVPVGFVWVDYMGFVGFEGVVWVVFVGCW